MNEIPTCDTMQADCDAALAILRAKGIPVPTDRLEVLVFRLGFSAGAAWVIEKIKAGRK